MKSLWLAGVIAAAVLPGCVASGKYMAVKDELARLQGELKYIQGQLDDAEMLLADASGDPAELEKVRQMLAKAEADKADIQKRLQDAMAAQGDLGAFTRIINAEEGMYGYRAQGDVLFNSGSATLTTKGKQALDAVIAELKKDNAPVRIDGHTDTDPVVKTKDLWKHGNIELGAYRAIAVAQYLEDNGIDEKRISIASFGEYKPVKSAADKSANRRVEIMQRIPMAPTAAN